MSIKICPADFTSWPRWSPGSSPDQQHSFFGVSALTAVYGPRRQLRHRAKVLWWLIWASADFGLTLWHVAQPQSVINPLQSSARYHLVGISHGDLNFDAFLAPLFQNRLTPVMTWKDRREPSQVRTLCPITGAFIMIHRIRQDRQENLVIISSNPPPEMYPGTDSNHTPLERPSVSDLSAHYNVFKWRTSLACALEPGQNVLRDEWSLMQSTYHRTTESNLR